MVLNKEQIFAFKDREIQKVEIPEWEGHVCVRVVTGAERLALESLVAGLSDGSPEERMMKLARIICMVACDEEGKPLFEESDSQELMKKSAKPLMRIVRSGTKLNSLQENDLEIAEKNLESSQT
ncbi:MAG: phage tail assembly chaperone [Candidatus Obscuribacterales bacterium]|nr:phage tail assembly chaperone [Candidatus Obscuribacterales bacterium]